MTACGSQVEGTSSPIMFDFPGVALVTGTASGKNTPIDT